MQMADLGNQGVGHGARPCRSVKSNDRRGRMAVLGTLGPGLPQCLDNVVLGEVSQNDGCLGVRLRLERTESVGWSTILGPIPVLIEVGMVQTDGHHCP
jgi:hypothetical protein